jgi:hypothetical protein
MSDEVGMHAPSHEVGSFLARFQGVPSRAGEIGQKTMILFHLA